MDKLSLASLIVGILSIIIGLFIALRAKWLFRPNYRFYPGIALDRNMVLTKYHNKPISTIIFGTNMPLDSYSYLFLPFYIENNSKLSASKIRLTFAFPAKNFPKEDIIKKVTVQSPFLDEAFFLKK